MSSWMENSTKWASSSRVAPSSSRARVTKKPRRMEGVVAERPTPIESASSYIQSVVQYEQKSDIQEEFKAIGGAKKSARKVGEYIDNLMDFDPDIISITTVSADYVKQMAVVEVTQSSDDPSVQGGVSDSRMGVTEGNSCCVTCRQVHCPGHFGKITLPVPVMNKIFQRDIIAVLDCVCNLCGTILKSKETVEAENMKISKLKGWAYLSAYSKTCQDSPCMNDVCKRKRKSSECKFSVNLKVSKEQHYITRNNGTTLTPQEVYDILDQISDEDVRTLGFNQDMHPRDLMIKVLPVVPPISRPPVFAGGKIKQDQLTHKYAAIVNTCNAINREIGSYKREDFIKDKGLIVDLYDHITDLICGGKKGRVVFEEPSDLMERTKGKTGLFRKAIQGKRVNFSGRAVLSPDVDLEFGEIGVPENMARFFHMPVDVTAANYKYVVALHMAGKIVSHTPIAGERAGLKVPVNEGDQITIDVGDKVERVALDGDMVVFNRQPTIHHGSLLGYTVRITHKGLTIGLHPSSTTAHNADFDGDAAMLLYPREARSVKEVRELIHTIRNLIDDTQNRPMAGIIIDGISAAYLLTKEDEAVNELIFKMVLGTMKSKVALEDLQKRAQKFGLHPYSGRTLFSALMPPDFIYNNGGIVVFNGILLSGRVKSSHIDTSHRSIVQDIWKQYGEQRAADFLTDATWLLIAWLDSYGFSIGPVDIDFGDTEKIKNMKKEFLEDINTQIRELGEQPKTKFEREKREEQVMSIIDRSLVFGKEIAAKSMREGVNEVFGRQNAIGIMAKEIGSGAKADLFNVAMMGGSVGQQYYGTKRPTMSLPGSGMFLPSEGKDETWGRFLPTMPIRPTDREAPVEERGYCPHSFSDGMIPSEAYAQAWGTRGDLINTSMSTAAVGEAHRRLSKAMEGIVIQKDGSVRASTGPIYQFSWGGDGLESMYMLMVNDPLYDRIPSFCDVSLIAEQCNARVGYMRKDYYNRIKQNKKLHDVVQNSYDKELKRVRTPVQDIPQQTVQVGKVHRIIGKPIRKTPKQFEYIQQPTTPQKIQTKTEPKKGVVVGVQEPYKAFGKDFVYE